MSKFTKLLNNPGEFFRDFLLKRYPQSFGGYNVTHKDIFYAEYFDSNLLISNDTDEDIDAVYTWVNDNDYRWKNKKNIFYNLLSNDNIYYQESFSDNRFRNHNELYFSILSIKKFAPWIRNIFIITDDQIPNLDSFDRITVIDHKQIVDKEYLPTFNSHVIEAHLHNIPGLSNNFIYLNDDVFLAKQLKKQHFFRKNGLASIFLANRSISSQYAKGFPTATLQASLNSIKLINKHFKIDFIDRPLVHTYIPLNKKIFNFCYTTFYEDIRNFLNNKFRSNRDLNMASFLVPWVMYLKGISFENVDICYYLNINSPSFYNNMIDLKKNIGTQFAPHSFCINDSEVSTPNNTDIDSILSTFMKDAFN